MASVLRMRSAQLFLAAALVAGGGVVAQAPARALTGACDLSGSSAGVHVGAEGFAVFGTEGDDVIVARGDCFNIDGFGGKDRITYLGGGYLKVNAIYAVMAMIASAPARAPGSTWMAVQGSTRFWPTPKTT